MLLIHLNADRDEPLTPAEEADIADLVGRYLATETTMTASEIVDA